MGGSALMDWSDPRLKKEIISRSDPVCRKYKYADHYEYTYRIPIVIDVVSYNPQKREIDRRNGVQIIGTPLTIDASHPV